MQLATHNIQHNSCSDSQDFMLKLQGEQIPNFVKKNWKFFIFTSK